MFRVAHEIFLQKSVTPALVSDLRARARGASLELRRRRSLFARNERERERKGERESAGAIEHAVC